MSIAEVIAWKFNNQSGMRCQLDEYSGTVEIVEFPGGVPSLSLQAQWTTEYQTWVANGGKSDMECATALDTQKVNRLVFEINFDQENRMRALEGKPTITRPQYRAALLAIWRTF